MDGFPNSRTSLLHQKLQMLNICIDRRKKRDEAALSYRRNSESSDSGSEDEFFDCEEEEEIQSKKKPKPLGRSEVFGDCKLLKTGEPMYVPVTQEAVPKTEDELDQDSDAIRRTGMDPEACLLSDMQSFKAANPDSVFEDFIRWYSPKDWILSEELDEHGRKKGHLSTRMLIPDNIWTELWKNAQMVPAKRQKRLFDDTVEAAKTLNYLESRTVNEIVNLLIPSLTHAVVFKLGEECKNKRELPKLKAMFKRAMSTATKLTRDRAEAMAYKNLADQIDAIESSIAQRKSLKMKFSKDDDDELVDFLTRVLAGEEAAVPRAGTGTIGTTIRDIFQSPASSYDNLETTAANSFAAPDEKEFVLRVMARRPSSTSRMSPQMMRVVLKKNEFRILGAFTEDVIFI